MLNCSYTLPSFPSGKGLPFPLPAAKTTPLACKILCVWRRVLWKILRIRRRVFVMVSWVWRRVLWTILFIKRLVFKLGANYRGRFYVLVDACSERFYRLSVAFLSQHRSKFGIKTNPKFNQKAVLISFKFHPKSIQNSFRFGPKSIQNWS